MSDRRTHRGAHPEDERLFSAAQIPRLREAVADLCWLLGRGYNDRAALKLVGDRLALTARQRLCVLRAACSDEARGRRLARQVPPASLRGAAPWIDGFNLLTTIEAALGGGVVLACRDGCYRDMASLHGSYRHVSETRPAIALVGEELSALGVGSCRWLLDSPVSNSGRLKGLLEEAAAQAGWDWEVVLAPDPDRQLMASSAAVVTADSAILDRCQRWCSLARHVVDRRAPAAWILDLCV
ncbi:MAG: DUF434 domain-containing protein [Myxococcales bacterium]|nr:DUF434 domain-containing protein [Myxococcota bacterium]MDW8283431.1 DUF434 domain-containing protein [Myxococcales bacterium]